MSAICSPSTPFNILKQHPPPKKKSFPKQHSSASLLVHHEVQVGLQTTPTHDNVHVKWALGSLPSSRGSPHAMKNPCGYQRLLSSTAQDPQIKAKVRNRGTHHPWSCLLTGAPQNSSSFSWFGWASQHQHIRRWRRLFPSQEQGL